MPAMNGTGPMGQGALTGRGMGACAGNMRSTGGRGMGGASGMRGGRGFGCGRGFGWDPTVATQVDKAVLKAHAASLEARLDAVKRAMNEQEQE